MTKLKELIKNNTVVVIDTETTGLFSNEGTAQIYEISARKIIDGDISNALFCIAMINPKSLTEQIAVNINVCKVTVDNPDTDRRDFSLPVNYSISLQAVLLLRRRSVR